MKQGVSIMATKRCEICHKARQIEEVSICCYECEEKELEMLLATYAFIHCFDADYCPVHELIATVPAVRGIKLNPTFIRSWLMKNWLEKNDLNSLRVPPPLYEEMKDNGFTISDVMRKRLIDQKEKKVQLNNVIEKIPATTETAPRIGMVFMEKHKDE